MGSHPYSTIPTLERFLFREQSFELRDIVGLFRVGWKLFSFFIFSFYVMKISGTSILWLLLGIASLLLLAGGSSTTNLRISEVFTDSSILSRVAATGRKLQGSSCSSCADEKIDGEDMQLEDYGQPIDPVPNWKASTRPGPIQHGAPLNPNIPKLPPPPTPDHPQVGGSP